MILPQVYWTRESAMARTREENRVSDRHVYEAVRFIDGEIDTGVWDERVPPYRYTWRIKRTSRGELARERDASRVRYARVLYNKRA